MNRAAALVAAIVLALTTFLIAPAHADSGWKPSPGTVNCFTSMACATPPDPATCIGRAAAGGPCDRAADRPEPRPEVAPVVTTSCTATQCTKTDDAGRVLEVVTYAADVREEGL